MSKKVELKSAKLIRKAKERFDLENSIWNFSNAVEEMGVERAKVYVSIYHFATESNGSFSERLQLAYDIIDLNPVK